MSVFGEEQEYKEYVNVTNSAGLKNIVLDCGVSCPGKCLDIMFLVV